MPHDGTGWWMTGNDVFIPENWQFSGFTRRCILVSSPTPSLSLSSLMTLCPLSSSLLRFSLYILHSSFSYSPSLPSLLLSSPPSGDTVTACVSQPLPASESCYWRLPYPAEIPVFVCVCAYVCKCMSARRWESNWIREGCLSSLRCHRHPFLSSSSAAMELQQAESQQHLQKGLR